MASEVVLCKEQSLLSALLAMCSHSTEAPDTEEYSRAQGFVLCGIYSNSSLLKLLCCIRHLPRCWKHLLSGFNDIFHNTPVCSLMPGALLSGPCFHHGLFLDKVELSACQSLIKHPEIVSVTLQTPCRCLDGCLL